MKRLSLFCAIAGLTLGTASLPQTRTVDAPVLLLYAPIDCTPIVAYSCAPIVGEQSRPPSDATPDARLEVVQAPPSEDEAAVAARSADPTEGVRVVVSLPGQMVYVFRDGEFIDSSPVSTGKSGHRTPTGTFPILQK